MHAEYQADIKAVCVAGGQAKLIHDMPTRASRSLLSVHRQVLALHLLQHMFRDMIHIHFDSALLAAIVRQRDRGVGPTGGTLTAQLSQLALKTVSRHCGFPLEGLGRMLPVKASGTVS